METCKSCGRMVDELEDGICIDCGFIELKAFIEELYKKQIQEEKQKNRI
ncbi:MAG: hypothetical protein ACXABO_11270 [Promethearchaeota archaeon]|jgi:ribosomal protein L37E